MRRDQCLGYSGRLARARAKKLIFSTSAAIYGVLAYPAILRAIEMVGRQNVYFVIFEDNRFILDAMEIFRA